AFMPSALMPLTSAVLPSTKLCPITALGNWPTCFKVTLNSLQVAGTCRLLVVNCIASVLSTVAAQSAAIAGAANMPAAPSRATADNLRIIFVAPCSGGVGAILPAHQPDRLDPRQGRERSIRETMALPGTVQVDLP